MLDVSSVPGEFRVVRYDVPRWRGDPALGDYGDPDSPRLRQLRREFALDEVVAGRDGDYRQIVALKRWVRSRWNHGYSRRHVEDGLDLLRAGADGERFACGYYARTLVDCATALGLPAREVGILLAECEAPRDYTLGCVGHVVAEVWCEEHGKWVLMDADMNLHYERDGVPLNALELHDAWLGGRAGAVTVIEDEPPFAMPDERDIEILRDMQTYAYRDWTVESMRLSLERYRRHGVLDYYARFRIGDRQWLDECCLPTFVWSLTPAPGPVRFTDDRDELYPALNLARPLLQPGWDGGGAWLEVTLEHRMPFFDRYETRLDGGSWQGTQAPFRWPMREGVNHLECRAVNVRGRAGAIGRVDVAYAAAQGAGSTTNPA